MQYQAKPDEPLKRPLISIIVPVYRAEKYLEQCVQSILGQTYTNIEVILVDDGSPDNSGAMCDAIAGRDSRIIVIHKENGGVSSARNAGIEAAKGEYIGFVDSDDTVEPWMYEKLYNAIIKDSVKLVVCAVSYVFEDGKKLVKKSAGRDLKMDFREAMTEMNRHQIMDMSPYSKLFHRSLFDEISFPHGKLSEDFYIMFKIFDRAGQISYIDTPCYNYFQHWGSLTHSKKINHDFEYAALEQMVYLEKYHPELKAVGHTAYASSVLTVFDFYLKNHVKCSKEKLKHFMDVVKENEIYIRQADFLTLEKRIQFRLFLISPVLYSLVFRLYRKIKRV